MDRLGIIFQISKFLPGGFRLSVDGGFESIASIGDDSTRIGSTDDDFNRTGSTGDDSTRIGPSSDDSGMFKSTRGGSSIVIQIQIMQHRR